MNFLKDIYVRFISYKPFYWISICSFINLAIPLLFGEFKYDTHVQSLILLIGLLATSSHHRSSSIKSDKIIENLEAVNIKLSSEIKEFKNSLLGDNSYPIIEFQSHQTIDVHLKIKLKVIGENALRDVKVSIVDISNLEIQNIEFEKKALSWATGGGQGTMPSRAEKDGYRSENTRALQGGVFHPGIEIEIGTWANRNYNFIQVFETIVNAPNGTFKQVTRLYKVMYKKVTWVIIGRKISDEKGNVILEEYWEPGGNPLTKEQAAQSANHVDEFNTGLPKGLN